MLHQQLHAVNIINNLIVFLFLFNELLFISINLIICKILIMHFTTVTNV